MPVYLYRARDAHGALIRGQAEASAEGILKTQLAQQGLIPIGVKKEQSYLKLSWLQRWTTRKVKAEEVLVFTRQFQSLFKAGLGMDAIFSALIRQCRNKTFAEVLKKIRNDVSAGGTLASAFAKHPQVFRSLYVNMLAAGEEAGILEETLRHLSGLLEKEMTIKVAIKSAILYPKIVVFVLTLAMGIMMTLVVPKFATFYTQFKATLPLPTLILIKSSHFISHRWYVIGALAALGYTLMRRFKKTVRGQLKLGELGFRLPVLGPLNVMVANARFCHILAALYRSGLPITRALEITGGTIENAAFQREVDLLRGELTRGRSLSEGMSRCRYFTPVIVEVTAAGEKSGALDEMLEGMGGHYDMEVGHTIKSLTTLLEPLLLVLVFGMVGLFALAIFLPIWNISQVVQGG